MHLGGGRWHGKEDVCTNVSLLSELECFVEK